MVYNLFSRSFDTTFEVFHVDGKPVSDVVELHRLLCKYFPDNSLYGVSNPKVLDYSHVYNVFEDCLDNLVEALLLDNM